MQKIRTRFKHNRRIIVRPNRWPFFAIIIFFRVHYCITWPKLDEFTSNTLSVRSLIRMRASYDSKQRELLDKEVEEKRVT
jgi:hypothetical protein